MAEVGIVIVTYNSREYIGSCLAAAKRTGADIVVIDNASTDSTLSEIAPYDVRIVSNSVNLGFAAAVNQGFRVLDCTYVLLLNPDTEVKSGMDALVDACRQPGVAGAGGRLVDADGRDQIGFMVRRLPTPLSLVLETLLLNRVAPNNPVNRRYRALDLDYSRELSVEQPAGAFLIVRKDVWRELGGFDEGFFPLWFEDVDFCNRVLARGHQLYYVPNATAQHRGAHSISQLSVENRRIYWYRSLLRYSAKHFRPMGFRTVCLAVVAGSFLRSVGEAVLQRSLQPLAAYAKVVKHASRCLVFGCGGGVFSSGPK